MPVNYMLPPIVIVVEPPPKEGLWERLKRWVRERV